jgi:hypothetical protein
MRFYNIVITEHNGERSYSETLYIIAPTKFDAIMVADNICDSWYMDAERKEDDSGSYWVSGDIEYNRIGPYDCDGARILVWSDSDEYAEIEVSDDEILERIAND